MELIVPHWRKYLRAGNKEIGKFITEMAARPEVQEQLAVCAVHREE
ncbi:MAG: hypothetical protein SGJ27_14355 [Candidatus Melainabacteria bacterium]|nr:hypothetical protein [Candidatus Melainabacteria bacterium]